MCVDVDIYLTLTNERLSNLGGFFCLELTLLGMKCKLPELYKALFYKTSNLS
jgi:hypothetical protein